VGTHLVGVCPERNTKRARKAKVAQLEVAFLVDEEVLGLEIAVKDAVGVAVVQALDELVAELLRGCQRESAVRQQAFM